MRKSIKDEALNICIALAASFAIVSAVNYALEPIGDFLEANSISVLEELGKIDIRPLP